MADFSEAEILQKAEEVLENWLEREDFDIRRDPVLESPLSIDYLATIRGREFIGNVVRDSNIPNLASALEELCKTSVSTEPARLILIPYMGSTGAKMCAENGVNWIDLSGNAHIDTAALYIHVEGRPNRFKSRGRPSNAFAPKSSRIARFLLQHASEYFTQSTIAKSTDLGKGYTSKIVRRLEGQDLIDRRSDGRVTVAKPGVMLDAWREKYDFTKHRIIRGTVAARDSRQLIDYMNKSLAELDLDFAATGLAAAWLMTRFARFRITTFFVGREPTSDWKCSIGLREDPKGANLWLVVPNDDGVFHGVEEIDRVPCVHPVQTYMDLKGHPERAEEAAEAIRNDMLEWGET